MQELYRSEYQVIEYYPEHSMIKRVLTAGPTNPDWPRQQHEWLEYARLVQRYLPQYILVNARRFDMLLVKQMQKWINDNVITIFNEIDLKKWAVVIPPEFLHQVGIEQTIGANPKNRFEAQYFENEEEAREWLENDHSKVETEH